MGRVMNDFNKNKGFLEKFKTKKEIAKENFTRDSIPELHITSKESLSKKINRSKQANNRVIVYTVFMILFILFLAGSSWFSSYKDNVSAREDLTQNWVFDKNIDGSLSIVHHNGSKFDIIVPSHRLNQPITRIGSFSDGVSVFDKTAFTVFISPGIKEIGNSCFANCSSLSTVNIPSSVVSIGARSFNNCPSLKVIDIPDSVLTLSGAAFSDCSNLRRVSLPNKISEIPEYSFTNCDNLKRINIPNGVKKIDKYAFAGCSSLETVLLPKSIEEIQDGAFMNCKSLTSIYISENIKHLHKGSFSGCKNLTVSLPRSHKEYTVDYLGCKAINYH